MIRHLTRLLPDRNGGSDSAAPGETYKWSR